MHCNNSPTPTHLAGQISDKPAHKYDDADGVVITLVKKYVGGENVADTDTNKDAPTSNGFGPARPCYPKCATAKDKLNVQLSEYQRKQRNNYNIHKLNQSSPSRKISTTTTTPSVVRCKYLAKLNRQTNPLKFS